jgi:hypothetical protein
MKKLCLIFILQVFIIGGFYTNSFAEREGLDGNTSLKICKDALKFVEEQQLSTQEKINGSYCGGFLLGFYESHLIEQENTKPKLYCMPHDIKTEQLNRIFVKYLEEHPERLREETADLLYASLKNAFPCEKKKK